MLYLPPANNIYVSSGNMHNRSLRHFMFWPKNNHVRQQQQETRGNKEDSMWQSSFKVVQLARDFGNLPVASSKPTSLVHFHAHYWMDRGSLFYMGDTHSRQRIVEPLDNEPKERKEWSMFLSLSESRFHCYCQQFPHWLKRESGKRL